MNPLRQRTLTSCTQPVSLAHHELACKHLDVRRMLGFGDVFAEPGFSYRTVVRNVSGGEHVRGQEAPATRWRGGFGHG